MRFPVPVYRRSDSVPEASIGPSYRCASSALTTRTQLGFWVTLDGDPLSDLANTIQTKMPMDNPGSLQPDQVADILAYLLSYSKFPAGQTELPKDPQSIKLIIISSTKPSQK